jgi:RecA/RadA recombinase
MLPLIKASIAAKNCLWIDTNQLRKNVRAFAGPPEYEPCGEAVRYFSDVRIKCKKVVPSGTQEYIEEEESWDQTGIDKYNHIELFTTKNKAWTPNQECRIRIWFEHNGEPLGIIDPVWDCYEYLRLTGQIVEKGRGRYILTMEGWNEPRKVTRIKYNDDYEVISEKRVKTNTWTWAEFKELILNPEWIKRGYTLREDCEYQIHHGKAFKLYVDRLKREYLEEEVEVKEVNINVKRKA